VEAVVEVQTDLNVINEQAQILPELDALRRSTVTSSTT